MLSLGSNISATQAVEAKYSASLDGTDDYINLDSFASLLSDDMAFSLSIWFKGSLNTGEGSNILFSAHNATYGNVIRIGVDASGSTANKGIFYSDASTSNHGGIGSTDLDDGEWHNLIVTRPAGAGGQQGKIYIDGGSALTTYLHDVDPSWTSATRVSIGQEYDDAAPSGITDLYEGKIGEVGFWNVELNDTSRLKVYNFGKPLNLTFDQGDYDNSSDLIGYWRMGNGFFDDKANGIIHDQGNAVTGSELVTNGNFSADSGWVEGTGYDIGSGTMSYDGSGSQYGRIRQGLTTEIGATYELKFTLSNLSASSVNFGFGKSSGSFSGLEQKTYSSNGTHTRRMVATLSDHSIVVQNNSATQTLDIDDVSVKKVSTPGFGAELAPSSLSIVNGSGGGTITQVSGNSYSSTSDGNNSSVIRPKFDFNTESGKTYKLVITPTGSITGTVHFDFNDGSSYLFRDYDFTTTKEIYFTDNGTVFGAFNGQQVYSISGFTISLKKLNGNPGLTSGGVTFSSDTP